MPPAKIISTFALEPVAKTEKPLETSLSTVSEATSSDFPGGLAAASQYTSTLPPIPEKPTGFHPVYTLPSTEMTSKSSNQELVSNVILTDTNQIYSADPFIASPSRIDMKILSHFGDMESETNIAVAVEVSQNSNTSNQAPSSYPVHYQEKPNYPSGAIEDSSNKNEDWIW